MVSSSLLGCLFLLSIASQTPGLVDGQGIIFPIEADPTPDVPLFEVSCPPPNLDALTSVELDAFLGSWHVLKQIPVVYQPVDDLFCVQADYTPGRIPPQPWYCAFLPGFCRPPAVAKFNILNTSRQGSVNGPKIVAPLQAVQVDTYEGTGKVRVGYGYLQGEGNYYIMAIGTYEELSELEVEVMATGANTGIDSSTGNLSYDWAIISSGLPGTATPNGCLPGQGPFNPNGFWLFSRDPFVSPEVVAQMEAIAMMMGFDTSALLDVANEGCDFS